MYPDELITSEQQIDNRPPPTPKPSGGVNRNADIIDMNAISENKAKLFEAVKNGWNAFHKYVVYILIAMAIGVGVGVKVSQKFYSDKMKDAVLVGGMVFEGKPYSIVMK